jgi:hypothetical protein
VYNVAMVLHLLFNRLSTGLYEKSSRPADSRFESKSSTIATLNTWPLDDGLKMSPKHVEAS